MASGKWFQIAKLASASLLISGCSGDLQPSPIATITETATVTPSSAPVEVTPTPKASDYLETSLLDYKIEEGGWLIEGYLTIKFRLENTSDEVLRGFATTVRVRDENGEVLFVRNLNREVELDPGEDLEFGLFGEERIGLFRRLPQFEKLLEMESLQDESAATLEVRKLIASDNSIITFVEDVPVPSEELSNETE